MAEELLTERDGAVLRVFFNRPAQRNAMTWEMYDGLAAACAEANDDDTVKAMVLRGVGDDAFIAGTDISHFTEFQDGNDGIAYEARISEVVGALERVRVPTVAAVSGYCVGGGLALASVCDIRVATTNARFGVPIARTVGNCLSMNTYSLLVNHLGPARTLDMLLRARLFSAEEAHAAGFVAEVCTDDGLDACAAEVTDRLAKHAPLTMWAAKEAVHRLRVAALPDGDDIVRLVFGSADFAHGVKSFLDKQKPQWTGR
ncbi:MAG: enoyl-CoA hydratase [Streptosporangiales bacterium]|nr:enoyl-CoA hydratase [Streptosporangiales bacterium]